MAHQTAYPDQDRSVVRRSWAVGGLIFAASMMIMLGVWQVFMGIAALVQDDFYAALDGYVYELDTTTWGWIHLVLGALVALTGFFLFTGADWARAMGIVVAGLAVVSNFLFLPYYPIWSIVVIALGVFVIWALATVNRRDLTGA